ncbi:MAG: hypothetical protein NZM11_08090, partial [Anaerolineales bacterium]|nr:hypothetical protein [Anaerolineales bacterium]
IGQRPLVNVARISHLTNWVWIVVGILQARSIALSQIALHIPGDAKAESRVTTIRRWLKNLRVDVWEFYRPVKENHELSSGCLQSPDDTEASYHTQGTTHYKGYVVNPTKTCDPKNAL